MNSITRRDFTRTVGMGAAALTVLPAAAPPARPTLCLFSKHLPKLNYADLARTVKQMGFEGVDLTVRAEGHVLPARAAEDLPRAVETIRAAGLSVPMITTGLTSASDPTARPTLATAGRLGVPFFKLGYWYYPEGVPVETRVTQVHGDVAGLVALARESNIVAGYHNHSGKNVGAAVWDIRAVIADLDPRWIGYYYDPCHATAEGGLGGWKISLNMVLPRMKMIALKDFYWAKEGDHWRMRICPMGEGMVDWKQVFATLAATRFTGPISLHMEYEPPDELAAIARDFEFVRRHIDAAYRGLS